MSFSCKIVIQYKETRKEYIKRYTPYRGKEENTHKLSKNIIVISLRPKTLQSL